MAGATVMDNGIHVNAANIIPHEDYNDGTYENDIALFELETSLTLGSNIAAISIPTSDVETCTSCTVTGWGDLDPDSEGWLILKYLTFFSSNLISISNFIHLKSDRFYPMLGLASGIVIGCACLCIFTPF